jgi:Protein of unknown function (DUF3738).
MSQLATALSNIANRHVVDRTNLPGMFDLRVRWMPDSHDAWSSAALDVLVVERVERPAPD